MQLGNRFDAIIPKIQYSQEYTRLIPRHNVCRSDGRLVKLFLFSTLLDTSPLTSIYFTTFERERIVRSPLPTQPNFLVFGIIQYTHTHACNTHILTHTIHTYSCMQYTHTHAYNTHIITHTIHTYSRIQYAHNHAYNTHILTHTIRT